MTSYVYDSVRSTLPTILLDDIFEAKDEIADAVKHDLLQNMPTFGYKIIKVLVNDIDIEPKVKSAMNDINMNARLRIAATEKAEADKILVVKAAEADAESKYLAGVGVSRQRQAIIAGLRESVVSFSGDVGGVTPQDVMQLLLTTQYFDMLTQVGEKSSVIFIPHTPGVGKFNLAITSRAACRFALTFSFTFPVDDVTSQLRSGSMQAEAANRMAQAGAAPTAAEMQRALSGVIERS